MTADLLRDALPGRWRVERISDDCDLVVLTFDRSLVTPAGVDVIARGAAGPDAARDLVPADRAVALHWLE